MSTSTEAFPALTNDLLLRAARQEPVERTPVWMMRQAGRYLPEYRALRADHDFFTVVRTPELAAEVTLQPIERFPLDAAIIFSDILVIPQALGLDVQMVKGKGPHFPDPLSGPEDLERLRTPDVSQELAYVFEALTLTRRRLEGRVPLIGFCGAPWTLMAYMIEGGGSKSFTTSRSWLYRHPEASRRLLQAITDVCVEYLIRQIDAGAQVVQVFDSWAGLLGPATFETFALPYLRQIAEKVERAHPDVPCIVFAKGAPYALPALADTAYDVISLDWTMDPREALRATGGRKALQGNLDPAALYAPPDAIRQEVRRMLQAFGPRGHIGNLGHGMHPDHDPEHARAFIEAVHEESAAMVSQS
ncbi:MAG: uroporphyrinogen decarboxylase [Bacteroidetes bacterium]|jgi:uroporphyrinogen decarboxylase|nr:uroporphyrinogen decarboxylase [Bacteroidota bacterium]